jgi:hypothetical protein
VEEGREGGDPLEETRKEVQEDLPHPVEKEVEQGTQKKEPCKEWQGTPPCSGYDRGITLKFIRIPEPFSKMVYHHDTGK